MTLPFKEKFEDIPIVNISRLLKHGNTTFLFVAEVAARLRINEERAMFVLKQLEKNGYVQKIDEINA